MKGFIILLGVFGLAGCHVSVIPSKDCVLQKIPVISTDPLRNETYVARAMTIEVQFRNENAPNPAEVFPDPLVTVKNITTAKSCDIKDGHGIWSSVYLDANERVLILNAYSGASDTLYFYDPKTCHKLAELDVSNKSWEISGDRIRTGQHCKDNGIASCRSIQELRLDSQCLVKESKSMVLK
jgi:hypothetical protein